MDNLEMAKALLKNNAAQNGNQTTTAYGIATSASNNGIVTVNLGGDTVDLNDDQEIEVETTFAIREGDEVIVSLIGADGTGKAPVVIGVVGRGDETQAEINAINNYFWTDAYGAHVSTEAGSVNGANVLLDSDSLDIRVGSSNSEADQTVLASFGTAVTVGSRRSGSSVGGNSVVIGWNCSATKSYSYAEGSQTKSIGICAHAEGEGTTAEGQFSHAEGYGCGTHGNYSHSEGYYTLAGSDYQHVQGKGNVTDDHGVYCDIIGNGENYSVNPSNAYNMDWNGNAEFQGEVYLGGCTPNGETPYPAVRYNTGSSQSEYYDSGTSAWTAVPGGGGSSWTLLWTNADPGSNFAAQTVSLGLSAYQFIAIVTQFSTSHDYESVNMVRVGGKSALDTANLFSTQYTAKRSAEVTSSGVTFSTGYRNTTGTTGTNYCIPVAIYGLA